MPDSSGGGSSNNKLKSKKYGKIKPYVRVKNPYSLETIKSSLKLDLEKNLPNVNPEMKNSLQLPSEGTPQKRGSICLSSNMTSPQKRFSIFKQNPRLKDILSMNLIKSPSSKPRRGSVSLKKSSRERLARKKEILKNKRKSREEKRRKESLSSSRSNSSELENEKEPEVNN